MNDERIVDYLRSRARATPPMDLVGSIADAIEGVPQHGHSWFAPFMPAAAAVAATAVVLVAAILVGQGPDAGPPPPGGSPTEGELAPPSPSPSPTPAPTLLQPGDSVTIEAVDADGRWGTVTLTRGEDVGGYGDGSVSAEAFVVEVHVAYLADESPDPPHFGAPDWTVEAASGEAPIPKLLEPRGRREARRPTMGTYPGAVDIFTTPLEGWLLFEVPRDAADDRLELVYQPLGFTEPVATFALREPQPAPDPVPEESPGPTPAPVTYVEKDGYPFTVIASAEADALFETPDTCTNPEAGYTVTYPDAWFTNTEIGDWPACTWFSPTFYDVGENPNEVPPQVAIVLVFADISYGYTGSPDFTHSQEVTVAGFGANRSEEVGMTAENGAYQSQPPTYFYTVYLGDQPHTQPTLRATTSFEGAADYELNKAVLDRIMALIVFDE